MNTYSRDSEVTMGEIGRALSEIREEVRALRSDLVRRDVYEAHRAATSADIVRIDTVLARQAEERTATRRGITLAVLAGVISLLVQVVTLLVGWR